MPVRCRLFASLKERIGSDSVDVDVPSPCTAGDLLAALAERWPDLAKRIRVCRLAVNQEFASPETRVNASDELALIPPVSGGAGGRPGQCTVLSSPGGLR